MSENARFAKQGNCGKKAAGKTEKVYRVFEAIHGNYDGANVRISLGMQKYWKSCLVRDILSHTENVQRGLTEKAGIRKEDRLRLLDVCCGTGDIALALAEKRPEARVTGIDFSQAMLGEAEKKGKNCFNAEFLRGDAMELPFPDETFSAVSISFGLRNTTDYERVLREMKRVLKPGGYLFCLDSFVPDSPVIRPFYQIYFQKLMPLLGGGSRYRKEYQWLWQSTRDFLTKDQLMKLFYQIGLRDVICKSYLFGACVLHRGRKM